MHIITSCKPEVGLKSKLKLFEFSLISYYIDYHNMYEPGIMYTHMLTCTQCFDLMSARSKNVRVLITELLHTMSCL